MRHKIHFKLLLICVISTLLCSACQNVIPKAQGLTSTQWIAQSYQRQDQIEVQWKTQGFSFLLYQQQQGQKLEMIALSLTGQQLFKLDFDGQKVNVQQRIEQMKRLPFDYLVRDILYATYPNFAQLHASQVASKQQQALKTIYIRQQPVLEIVEQDRTIEVNNVQVPYQMVISQVNHPLENDGDTYD